MTEIELHAALVTVLVPACATAVGLLLAVALGSSRPAAQGLMTGVALALGVAAADVGIRGWQDFWPADITRRLPHVVLLVVAVSAMTLVAARAYQGPARFSTLWGGALTAGMIALVFAMSPLTSELAPLAKSLWWGVLAIVFAAGQIAIGPVAARRPGAGLPLLLACVAAACAAAVAKGGSLSLGQVCGGVAVCLTTLAAFAWRWPALAAHRVVGELPAAVLGAVLAAAHSFAELPMAAAVLLYAMLLVPWLGEVGVCRRRPLLGWFVQLAAIFALGAVALAIVWADRPTESSVYG